MDLSAADRHLSRCDPVMKRLVKAHGPCGLTADPATPFAALVRAITHQQLHGRAAETILGRLRARFPRKRLPTPVELLALPVEVLRADGFSGAKAAALHDLAAKAQEGVVPTARALASLSDDEIVERLTVVRGVGRWTVEMMLMFRLGRPDVWPTDDFGVRNGYAIAYGLREMPSAKALMPLGEPFKPWRSAAAWYLWRAADQAKAVRAKSATA
jgi:DNA-3-methyladenine glycosylase II